ncbi:hypothetical protein MMC30_006032 [Trapelia coarctata]|nr:hypothetical protein [Trapelia coarctata]
MTITYCPEMGLFTQSLHPSESPTTLTVTYHPPTSSPNSSPTSSPPPPPTITIPLHPPTTTLSPITVTLHASPTKAYDMGLETNAWFSAHFGFEVKLVYLGPHLRAVLGNLSPNAGLKAQTTAVGKEKGTGWLEGISSPLSSLGGGGGGDGNGVQEEEKEGGKEGEEEREGITFADVAAYLVITEESLKNVSARLPEEERPMDITKFRPNIVLAGSSGAWDEDFWGGISIVSQGTTNDSADRGATNIILTQNCARCVSLNVDYETGKIGTGESGKVLKKLMKDRRVDAGAKWSPIFGRYGFLDGGSEGKIITVGDEVVITKRNEERTTFGK